MKPKHFAVLLIAMAFAGWIVENGLFGMRSYPSNWVGLKNDGEPPEYPGFDEPQQFFKFHKGIRMADDELHPGYGAGYKTIELEEAKARSSATIFARSNSTNGVIAFKERGPWNVPGRMRAILVLPTDPNRDTWLAGAATGGIWKTSDGGKTWVEKSQDFSVYPISSFAMSGANPNIIYAGTGELHFYSSTIGDGIYKSNDGGETWTQLVSTAKNPDFSIVTRIIADPVNPNILLASTSTSNYAEAANSKIMRSTNGGNSWTEVYQSPKDIQQIISTPSNFNIQYATIRGRGIIKSINGGVSWALSGTGMVPTGRIELAISPANPNRLYASCQGAQNGINSDLYTSSDAGQTWTLVNLRINNKLVDYLGSQGDYNNHVLCDPFNENSVYVGGVDTFRADLTGATIQVDGKTKLDASTQTVTDWYGRFDGKNAQNFVNLDVGGPHVDHHFSVSIVTSNADKTYRIVLATDGGIFVSKSAQNPGVLNGDWTFAGFGLNTGQFYGVDKKPQAEEYIGGMQDNGTRISMAGQSASKFTKYRYATGGDGGEAVWHTKDPNKIMASSYGDLFYRSVDGGATWSPAWEGFSMYQGSIDGSKYPFLSKLAYSRNVPDLLYSVGNEGVWINSNFGTSWVLSPITEKWGFLALFFDVEVSRADPKIVWAGSGMSGAPNPRNLHVSLNSGSTFQATNNFSPVVLGNLTKLATHPTQPNTAYALFSFFGRPKVIRTTDLGKSWTDISGFGTNKVSNNGFPDVAVYCLYVMPDNPNIIWAGTEIGIVESQDNGATWALLNDFPKVSVWDMKGQDDEIVIATFGRGIWTAKMTSNQNPPQNIVTGAETSTQSSVLVVYPNPTAGKSIIQFEINEPGNVTVDIVHMSGKTVSVVDLGSKAVGVHSEQLDFQGFEKGIYILKLRTSTFNKSIKIVYN
jgi:photosystem II stability/assembly factor-like uncharacterized protein